MKRLRSAPRADRSLDAVRLALAALREAQTLQDVLDQVCVGATRVTAADAAILALEHGGKHDVAATAGRTGTDAAGSLVRQLELAGALRSPGPGPDGVVVARLSGDAASGAVIASGARPESRPALELFAEVAAALVDLHVLRGQVAAAAHRLQPLDRVPEILASLRPGDGVVIVDIDARDELRRQYGDMAVDSVTQAAGVHLLNATRPPGDVVLELRNGRFLVVLRDLKAPVEVVVHRFLETWRATKPTAALNMGAALHLDGNPPLGTVSSAEEALASAAAVGGGQAHVTPPPRAR